MDLLQNILFKFIISLVLFVISTNFFLYILISFLSRISVYFPKDAKIHTNIVQCQNIKSAINVSVIVPSRLFSFFLTFLGCVYVAHYFITIPNSISYELSCDLSNLNSNIDLSFIDNQLITRFNSLNIFLFFILFLMLYVVSVLIGNIIFNYFLTIIDAPFESLKRKWYRLIEQQGWMSSIAICFILFLSFTTSLIFSDGIIYEMPIPIYKMDIFISRLDSDALNYNVDLDKAVKLSFYISTLFSLFSLCRVITLLFFGSSFKNKVIGTDIKFHIIFYSVILPLAIGICAYLSIYTILNFGFNTINYSFSEMLEYLSNELKLGIFPLRVTALIISYKATFSLFNMINNFQKNREGFYMKGRVKMMSAYAAVNFKQSTFYAIATCTLYYFYRNDLHTPLVNILVWALFFIIDDWSIIYDYTLKKSEKPLFWHGIRILAFDIVIFVLLNYLVFNNIKNIIYIIICFIATLYLFISKYEGVHPIKFR